MASGRFNETLLQWIWENLEFDNNGLMSESGESIRIIDTGVLNHGSGPDFLQACIRVDGIRLYGHVELHNHEQEWRRHGHQKDENFNNVILHVILEGGGEDARTSDGYRPAVLNLQRYLSGPLYSLLRAKSTKGLPCGDYLTVIHQEAFERQVEIAHRQYFTYKVDRLVEAYDPHLPPSEAWTRCLLHNVYSALGIPANREAMEELFEDAYEEMKTERGLPEIRDMLMERAFSEEGERRYHWRRGGMRPGSLPDKRVGEAAALHDAVSQMGVRKFLRGGTDSWRELVGRIHKKDLPGRSRLGIIEHTVFLPAIYLLGDLFHSEELCSQSFRIWKNSTHIPPKEVCRPFLKAGYKLPSKIKKLGLAHQYKRFCRAGNCHKCEVFKSAISS